MLHVARSVRLDIVPCVAVDATLFPAISNDLGSWCRLVRSRAMCMARRHIVCYYWCDDISHDLSSSYGSRSRHRLGYRAMG
ncbi:hypothetical protein B296_00057098 [Ensete ventricosum]|uniref:Uncharacterized protein n=1 Tax=Ensete ventricosum TaxID=4639 RepID=A0A426XSP8_ENSVE|nr:hypothetical protein B296_00057098 [Ensete ventricosum]